MYKNFAVNKLSTSIKDVILPKFNIYYQDRQNDISIKELIEDEITHIEDLEDLVIDITENHDFSNYKGYNTITIDGYSFRYNKELEDFEFSDDKEAAAKYRILSNEGLLANWSISELIRNRIDAILVTLEETSFNEILKIVENSIDFNEFINLNKTTKNNKY